MKVTLNDVPWRSYDTDSPVSEYDMNHNRAGDPYESPGPPRPPRSPGGDDLPGSAGCAGP